MSLRPIIGITTDNADALSNPPTFESPAVYADAVAGAGGLPLLLPQTHDHALREEMLSRLDGLVFAGGDDLNPALYGQPLHAKTRLMHERRQAFDLAMLALAEQANIPTLGICLGFQEMNVQRGGTLHQYLPEAGLPGAVLHAGDPLNVTDRNAWHDVAVAPGSRLQRLCGQPKLKVNSRHRQGLARLGHGLTATGVAPDGTVEAIEDATLAFWLGVQWHAEAMAEPQHQSLFAGLVAAARVYQAQGR